jgi:hypothetical protein
MDGTKVGLGTLFLLVSVAILLSQGIVLPA